MKDTKWIWIGLIIALMVGGFLSMFASPSPDGLERVAEDKGFIERAAEKPLVKSPIPDYLIPGVPNERLATAVAGIVGTLILFALGYGMGKIIGRKQS